MRILHFLILILSSTVSCSQSATHQEVAAESELRLVSLHSTTTEILVQLGAIGDLIAISETTGLTPYSANSVHSVPRLPRRLINVEELVALSPTHVFGTEAMAESQPGIDIVLRRAGIELVLIDPVGLAGLWHAIESVGGVTDREPAASSWIQELRAKLQAAESEHSLQSVEEPIRVFFYDCCNPPFTAGGRVPLTEILTTLGARNIFDQADQDWQRVSWEAVLSRKPEVIVVHDYVHDGQGSGSDKIANLLALPGAAEIPAIRNALVQSMPLALALEGPRTLESIDVLAPLIKEAWRMRGDSRMGERSK